MCLLFGGCTMWIGTGREQSCVACVQTSCRGRSSLLTGTGVHDDGVVLGPVLGSCSCRSVVFVLGYCILTSVVSLQHADGEI